MSSVVFTINHVGLPGNPNTNPPQPVDTASIVWDVPDDLMQRVFAMLLRDAAPVVEVTMVPGPQIEDPNNPGQMIDGPMVEQRTARARTLGECMKDETGVFVEGLRSRVAASELRAAQAALAAPADVPAATPNQ